MEDWQQRVYDERFDLERKIQKLNIFMNHADSNLLEPKLGKGERCRLMEQLHSMEAYHDALTDRIFNFEVYDETE